MKYRVSQIPDSQKSMNFRFWTDEGKEEVVFNFARPLLVVWGNPGQDKLREVMVAYTKKNGWSKKAVVFDLTNSLKNMTQYIHSLAAVKAA